MCLMRIAEASATSSEKLDVLCSHGLIPQAARLISVSNTAGSLVPQTSLNLHGMGMPWYSRGRSWCIAFILSLSYHCDVGINCVCLFWQVLIRLLSTCASGSAAAAESLLQLRISSILKNILAGSGLVSSTSVSPSSVNRPPEQVMFFSPEGF